MLQTLGIPDWVVPILLVAGIWLHGHMRYLAGRKADPAPVRPPFRPSFSEACQWRGQ